MGVVPPRESGSPKHQPIIVGGQDGRYRPEGLTGQGTPQERNPEVTFESMPGLTRNLNNDQLGLSPSYNPRTHVSRADSERIPDLSRMQDAPGHAGLPGFAGDGRSYGDPIELGIPEHRRDPKATFENMGVVPRRDTPIGHTGRPGHTPLQVFGHDGRYSGTSFTRPAPTGHVHRDDVTFDNLAGNGPRPAPAAPQAPRGNARHEAPPTRGTALGPIQE